MSEANKSTADMVATEAFHRLKRTSLLLSSALIVLALATPTGDRALKLGVVDAVISTSAASALLWIAALYYVGGFCLEASAVRRTNVAFMRGAVAADYEAKLEEISAEIAASSRILSSDINQIAQALSASLQAAQDINIQEVLNEGYGREMAANVTQYVRMSGIHDTPNMTDVEIETAARRGFSSAHAELVSSIGREVARLRSAGVSAERMEQLGSSVEERTTQIADRLSSISISLRRLSPRIAIERRIGFYAWEIGGVFAVFGLATITSAPHLLEICMNFVVILHRYFTAPA